MKNFLILFLCLPVFLIGQSTKTLSTSSIQVEMSSDGFVSAFNVPNAHTGSMSSILSRLSFWIVGRDEGQFLYIADSDAGHFHSGFRNVPNSDKIWKVTKAEIDAHLLDFQQDGLINDTISSIFSWPTIGNVYSQALNGFSMDSVPNKNMAWNNDWNLNGIYEPEMGEFPILGSRYIDSQFGPTEILFMPLYTTGMSLNERVPNFDIGLTAFVFDCPNQEGLNKSVFFHMEVNTREDFDFKDVHFSLLADGNIGNPEDDYVGSWETRSTAFFYNSTENVDSIFGVSPPALFIDYNYGLIDTSGGFKSLNGISTPFKLNLSPLVNPNMQMPRMPYEYYNYSQAKWRDGSSIRTGGNGYGSSPSNMETKYIFSGDPGIPSEWSEVSAQTLQTDRTVLLIGESVKIKAESKNRLFFNISYVDDVNHSNIRQRILDVSKNYEEILFRDFPNPPLPTYDTLCYGFVSTQEKVSTEQVAAFPNPTKGYVQIQLDPQNTIKSVTVFNAQGMAVRTSEGVQSTMTLDLAGLPAGLYNVFLTDTKGRSYHSRIVKQ